MILAILLATTPAEALRALGAVPLPVFRDEVSRALHQPCCFKFGLRTVRFRDRQFQRIP